MGSIGKAFSIVIIGILAVSVLSMNEVSYAQIMPKPFASEFTLKYVDNSYDVPPTYGIDPYTGKNVMTQAGYRIQNKSIEITIKNQPFTSYRNENNSLVGLWYYVLVKGHFQDWYTGTPNVDRYIYRSNSEYTVIGCGLSGNNGSDPYRGNIWLYESGVISDDAQIDFKIQALIGYKTQISRGPYAHPFGESYYYVFTGESSDWSNVQTISIPDGTIFVSTPPTSTEAPTATPSQNPTATPQQPNTQSGVLLGRDWEQISIILLGVTVVVLAVALLFSLKRKAEQTLSAS